MKKFFVGCVLAAMVAMTVVAVSCSKDDDDNADNSACWYFSYVEDGELEQGYVWATKSEIDQEVKNFKAIGISVNTKKTNHSKEECEQQY